MIRAAAFRDRIQLGRKRSIQILEHFDRIGLTRRFGNERKVRRDSALAQVCGSNQLAGDHGAANNIVGTPNRSKD